MKLIRILLVVSLVGLWYAPLFASISQMKVIFKEYKSANDTFGAVRVTIINDSSNQRTGKLSLSGRQLIVDTEITLKAGEKKIFDMPVYLFNNSCSVIVQFGNEVESTYINIESGKSYANGVLEIKNPGKGQLFFHLNSINLDTQCVLESIELNELPTNLYCLFPFQIIVIPTEIEATLSAEQIQLIKSYIGFGGKVMLIDSQGEMPARWKNLGSEKWGSVFAVKKADSIDFSPYLSKKNIFDPKSGFYKTVSYPFLTPSSSKGIYLIIVIIFIIIIGPFNFYFLKKRNKAYLIFFTAPIISLIFSGLLIGVFFIKEGFYKHYEGLSLTMINPNTNQALVNIRNSVYSSNILGKASRPRNGMYFPQDNTDMMNNFKVDLGDYAYLSGGFSKARTANSYGEIRLIECNSKISVRKEGNNIFAKNGFGSKQKIMVLDRVNRKYYQSKNFLEPDKEEMLIPIDEMGFEFLNSFVKNDSFKDILKPVFNNLMDEMLYIGISDTNEMIPFREKDGFIQGQNLHLIIGVIKK